MSDFVQAHSGSTYGVGDGTMRICKTLAVRVSHVPGSVEHGTVVVTVVVEVTVRTSFELSGA